MTPEQLRDEAAGIVARCWPDQAEHYSVFAQMRAGIMCGQKMQSEYSVSVVETGGNTRSATAANLDDLFTQLNNMFPPRE